MFPFWIKMKIREFIKLLAALATFPMHPRPNVDFLCKMRNVKNMKTTYSHTYPNLQTLDSESRVWNKMMHTNQMCSGMKDLAMLQTCCSGASEKTRRFFSILTRYHALCTMGYHGVPWVPWGTMGFHGAPWGTMWYHAVPWGTMCHVQGATKLLRNCYGIATKLLRSCCEVVPSSMKFLRR